MKIWLVILLLALGIVTGSLFWWHFVPPSERAVIGIYIGEYRGYVDRVELTKNHEFNQILKTPKGETLISSGTWKLTNNALDMDGYIFFIEEQVAGSFDHPYKTSLTFGAYRGMLVRDWDAGFYRLDKK